MQTSDFDYHLPEELIAQHPAQQRDQSKLLVLERASGTIRHTTFSELLTFLRPADCLILNNSRVFPARLHAVRASGTRLMEILLLEEEHSNCWWAMVRPGKKAPPGAVLNLVDLEGKVSPFQAEVLDVNDEGHRRVGFSGPADIRSALPILGQVPLPPYINRPELGKDPVDAERYQTVYAECEGSVAAPTAGLHFTPALLQRIQGLGCAICPITLHVGLGTFAPVKTESLEDHPMHEESYSIPEETARSIMERKSQGGRLIAIGTTSVRVMETAARSLPLQAESERTRIFIYPPYEFRLVDALITNFHLPRSTLLMLVSAFCAPGCTSGKDLILKAYREAIREKYRFFSYGDAMLIL